jgi:hypothetical protein
MKKYKILTAVMAAAVMGGTSAMAQFNYQNGDMLAAFGNGTAAGSKDIIVDLGSIANFQPGPATQTWDLSSYMTSQFGGLSSSVYWAVLGANNPGLGTFNHAVWQADTYTFWSTVSRADVNTQNASPDVVRSRAQNAAVNNIISIGQTTLPGSASPGLITDLAPGVESVDVSAGIFSTEMSTPYNGNLEGSIGYNVLNNGAGVSDLFQNDPRSGATTTATYLGNFTLDNTGILTFSPVPEPSTWMMIGSGAAVLLAFRRRK